MINKITLMVTPNYIFKKGAPPGQAKNKIL